MAIWEPGGPVVSDFTAFIRQFKTVFDHLDQGRSSSQRLLQLRQGADSVADYAVAILAAKCGWNDVALLPVFRCGLCEGLQLELTCRNTGLELDQVIELAINLDQHLREKVCHTSTPKSKRSITVFRQL